MSDLISREALLEAHQDLVAFGTDTSFAVRNLITNAPAIEQGEPKGYMWPEVESISLYKDEFFTVPLYTSPPQPQVVKDAPAVESETSYCGKDYSVGSGGFEKVYVCGEDDGQCGWCKCLDYRSPAVKDALEKAAKICEKMQKDENNTHIGERCSYGTCQIQGSTFAKAIRALIEKE